MEWTNITSKTLLTQIPTIVQKNNANTQAYMDLFYDASRGVITTPLDTTGRVKAGNGQFVNLVVDNISVKNQYTNLYDNITTADYDFYKTTSDVPVSVRDASLTAVPHENPSYKYIDVNKPYYKISNTSRVAFKSDNLSQVVHVMFDLSTNLGNDYIIQLNPRTNEEFKVTVSDAETTWVEIIMTAYDASWGGYWDLYRYGTLDASTFGGGGDASYGTVSLGDPKQLPFVNGAGNDFSYSQDLEWDGTRLNATSTQGTNNIYIGDKASNSLSNRSGTIAIGYEAGKSLTTGNGGTYLGHMAGASETNGELNTYVGIQSGFSNTIGDNNTYLGANAGYLATGINNVFVGANAGYYETDSNVLFIDNQTRVSKTISKLTSLIYGKFNSTVESQVLRFNAQIELPQIDASIKDNVLYFDTVTNRISYGIQTGGDVSTMKYGNGITVLDASIEFGGELLRNTSLIYNNTQSELAFNNDSGNLEFNAYNGTDKVDVIVSSGNDTAPEILLSVDNEADKYSNIDISYAGITFNHKDPSNGISSIIIDGSGVKASKNFKDYYTARSFVDKEYVDIAASGGLEVSLGSAMEVAFMNDLSTGFQYDSNFMWDGRRIKYQDSSNNLLIGSQAGWENNGENNVFIGQSAGYNIQGSNKLVIANNHDLTDILSEKAAMIYGEFNDDVAIQMLRINAELELSQIKPAFQDYILYWDPSDGKVSFQLSPTGTISFGEMWEIPFMNPTTNDLWYNAGFTFNPSEGVFDVSANFITNDVSARNIDASSLTVSHIDTSTIIATSIDASVYDNVIFYNPSTGEFGYGESTTSSVFFNGLSVIDSSVTLGGFLEKDTTIDLSTYKLALSGGETFISDISVNKFKFNDDSASEGYFMTTDSSGLGSWAAIPSSVDVSFGAATQIPFMTVDGSNFEYSDNITFDGSILDVDGSVNAKDLTVSDYQYMGTPNNDGSWRFYVSNDASADLIFEKRVLGIWTEGTRIVIE